MTLIQTIKQDILQARKNKDKTLLTILSTLLGDVAIIGKNDGGRETTDSETIAVIKKFIKNIEETMQYVKDSNRQPMIDEQQILEQYLPKQLSHDELVKIVNEIIEQEKATSIKQMGIVMKGIRELHEGEFDGRLVSDIIKKILTSN